MGKISEKLTQQKLLEILLAFYQQGNEKEHINVADLVEEIKERVMIIMNEK